MGRAMTTPMTRARAKLIEQHEEIQHLRAGLHLIANRAAALKRPNGTTKVLERIAVAALAGQDIEEAAERKST